MVTTLAEPASPDGPGVEAPLVVDLDDPRAAHAALVGGKAAALSRARAAGLATVPGVVLTTRLSDAVDAGRPVEALLDADVRAAIGALGGGPLAVRSSSVVEDAAESSAAGQFASVLDVRGASSLDAAVAEVVGSRRRAGAEDEPIAVLVQPMVEPHRAGVAFGVDPVSGRSDRRVVTAVAGSPDALVSGDVEGSRWELDAEGRVLTAEVRDGATVDRRLLRLLVELLDRVAEVFDGPQDVEWAQVDERLLLLQSRPVTTPVRGVPDGPVYGPGPVAETFPDPLAPLEQDLWVPPLREAVREAIRITGGVSARALDGRELVVAIDGRVAIDLEATGEERPEGRSLRLGLAGQVRRLRSAWRVGRLRAALPLVADELSARVDADLEDVPSLDHLTVRQLVALMERGREALRSLHAHEILLGLVADTDPSAFTGASVALRVLAEARQEGLSDAEVLRRAPVVLALVPPAIGAPAALPSDASAADLAYDPPAAPDAQVRREALRLRVRWVQELTAQAALEVGRRLARRGTVAAPEHVRQLRLDELAALVSGRAVVAADHLAERVVEAADGSAPALPARFQVSDRGLAVPVAPHREGDGTGAGGGVGSGPVTHDASDPPDGSVLVVEALRPDLGPVLPRLNGIVAETGSVLSHLAILAREAGVATVVGREGSVAELADGTVVRVDGQSGRVEVEEAA